MFLLKYIIEEKLDETHIYTEFISQLGMHVAWHSKKKKLSCTSRELYGKKTAQDTRFKFISYIHGGK